MVSEEKKRKNESDDDSEKKENINNNNSNDDKKKDELRFFIDEFQSATDVQLSSIELETLKDEETILELSSSKDTDKDVEMLGIDIKASFGNSWKEVLCGSEIIIGKIPAGSPSVLIIASSALRCIHLLKGFRSLTKQCNAVKLFSKHIKLEEQISLLKNNRVNIASGTPSRIKKLIDMEEDVLGLSRLKLIVLDMHPDVKGYSLFTLPQVRDEFWELFKNYFYQPMIQGHLRICLYGGVSSSAHLKPNKKQRRPLPVPHK